jgi:hypothetical protein
MTALIPLWPLSPLSKSRAQAQDREQRQSANLADAADARMRTVHFSTLAKAKAPVTAAHVCRMTMMKRPENVFGSHSS